MLLRDLLGGLNVLGRRVLLRHRSHGGPRLVLGLALRLIEVPEI